MKSIIITGGAGFIGSHVVRLFVTKYPNYRIINVDKLTYAGNLANLKDIEKLPNYRFVKADICDKEAISKIFAENDIDRVVHFAAESHVDRSIENPFIFLETNIWNTEQVPDLTLPYSDTSIMYAMVICAIIPIIIIYPYIQKYFAKGVNMGGVKE